MRIRKKPAGLWRRQLGAVLLGTAVLWLVGVTAMSTTAISAADAIRGQGTVALQLLEAQLGNSGDGAVPCGVGLCIAGSPLLAGGADRITELRRMREADDSSPSPLSSDGESTEDEDGADPVEESPKDPATPLLLKDNGVPARTLSPSSPDGYLVWKKAYIRNTSDRIVDEGIFDAPLCLAAEGAAPKVLIYHTHTTEAYTMPAGEEYEASGDCRTLDESCSVVRVGSELAEALERQGISVLHDSTLHDYPEYSGSYGRSLATVERILEENPSITVALDIHRDAVQDREGNQFKVVGSVAGLRAAQMSIIVGTDGGGLEHPHWQTNLRLAGELQNRMEERYPTLMRPITVRNSRYNQHVAPGALLIEMGAAGNSLDEALLSAELLGEVLGEILAEA